MDLNVSGADREEPDFGKQFPHFGFEPWDRIVCHRAVFRIVTDHWLRVGLERRLAASAAVAQR